MEAASEPSDFNKMVKKGSGFESLVQTINFLIFISHILHFTNKNNANGYAQ